MKVSAFLTAALAEIGVGQAGDALEPEAMDLALLLWNEILDAWNADDRSVCTVDFSTSYTLTANLNPHTIGISGAGATFTIPTTLDGGTGTLGARPDRIPSASLIINTSSPALNRPIYPMKRADYLNIRQPAQTTSTPTRFYYEPDWPLGKLWLYPVPTVAYGIQLAIGRSLAQMALGDTFTLAPGYQMAMRLTLAEALCGPFLVPVPQNLPERAKDARAIIFGDNIVIPRLRTADSGLRFTGRRSTFDYRTGHVS